MIQHLIFRPCLSPPASSSSLPSLKWRRFRRFPLLPQLNLLLLLCWSYYNLPGPGNNILSAQIRARGEREINTRQRGLRPILLRTYTFNKPHRRVISIAPILQPPLSRRRQRRRLKIPRNNHRGQHLLFASNRIFISTLCA